MSLTTNPTTELEAINTMLSVISELPVSSLGSGLPIAETAERILGETNRSVQATGWRFNTELKWKLTPDQNGELVLPANCTSIDDESLIQNAEHDYVLRGKRLYDRIQHTYKIDQIIIADMVLLLDFQDLPEPARSYIAIKSARIFQDRILGSAEVHSFTSKDEEDALINLNALQIKSGGYNMKKNSTVFSILDRRI